MKQIIQIAIVPRNDKDFMPDSIVALTSDGKLYMKTGLTNTEWQEVPGILEGSNEYPL